MGEEIGSKTVVRELYGIELADAMAAACKSYRAILEPTTPVIQCVRAGHPFIGDGTDVCYICGLPIPSKDNRPVTDWLYVECEHILPIVQARIFLDIYTHLDNKGAKIDPVAKQWYETAINLEYAQSHRLCNQKKKMQSYIGNPEYGETSIQYNDVSTKAILKSIIQQATDTVNEIRNEGIDVTEEDWNIYNGIAGMKINERAKYIKAIITRIENHVNTHTPDEYKLLTLARISRLRDPTRLPPCALAVYEAWNGAGIVIRVEETAADKFATGMLEFKFLQPGVLSDIVYGGAYLQIPDQYRLNMTVEIVRKILHEFYELGKASADTNRFLLLNWIYYFIYWQILGNYSLVNNENVLPQDKEWICKLCNALTVIRRNKQLNKMIESFVSRRENANTNKFIYKNTVQCRRDELNKMREDAVDEAIKTKTLQNTDPLILLAKASVEDLNWLSELRETAANDTFSGITDIYLPELKKHIINVDDANARNVLDSAVNAGRQEFIENYNPEEDSIDKIVERASMVAAETLNAYLILGNVNADLAKSIADDFRKTIIAQWPADVSGGSRLRKLHRSKPNARRSHSRNIRTTYRKGLRKRTGKGRTHRVRQRTGKSRGRK